nr:MAG TPA: hypothetical protein [Caudoviricetes sp.]
MIFLQVTHMTVCAFLFHSIGTNVKPHSIHRLTVAV